MKVLKSQVTGNEVEISEKKDFLSKVELIIDGKKIDGLTISDGAKKVTFRMHVSADFANSVSNETGYTFSLTINELPSKKNMELPYQLIHEKEGECDWNDISSKGYLDFDADVSGDGILQYLINEDGLFDKETIIIDAKLSAQDKKDWSVFQIAAQADISLEMGGEKMNNNRKENLISEFKVPSRVTDKALLKRVYQYSLNTEKNNSVDVYTVFVKYVTEKPLQGKRNIEAKVSYKNKEGKCSWKVVQIEETSSNHLSHYIPQYGGSLPCSIGDKIRNTQNYIN
jgi:hypothetical protein